MFEEGAIIRRVAGEVLPLLGGGRAILLQLAHPLIAAGVAEHGSFQQDPLGRLFGTLRFVHTIVFGTRDEAERAAVWLEKLHVRVSGETTEATGRYSLGTPYEANDPELARWVFATLIDSSLVGYQKFVAPLSDFERERYYEQTKTLARLLEVPESLIPATLDAFDDYVRGMIESGRTEVTTRARRLAREVLHPDVSGLPAFSAALLRFVTAGTLPEPLREAYNLTWNARRQTLLDLMGRTTRTLRPWMPRWIWQSPLLGPGLARLLLRGMIEDSPGASLTHYGQTG